MVKKPGSAAAQAPTKVPKDATEQETNPGRFRQIGIVAGIVRKSNRWALPIVIGSGVGIIALFVLIGLLVGGAAFLIPLGVLIGVATSMIIFGRFAQSAQYAAIAGQPGAAAAVVQSMRGDWTVTPAIAANRNMDIVHRVVGRPGIILVGEGSPAGLASLLSAEKKKLGRVAYGIQVHEIQVGSENGQIQVSKLQRKLMNLPRSLKPGAVTDLNNRMKSLPSSLQTPKGPMPRAARMPKPPRPKTR
jgi:hypothetical protein